MPEERERMIQATNLPVNLAVDCFHVPVDAFLKVAPLQNLTAKTASCGSGCRLGVEEYDNIRLEQAHFRGARPGLVEAFCERVRDARKRVPIRDKVDSTSQICAHLRIEKPPVRREEKVYRFAVVERALRFPQEGVDDWPRLWLTSI